MRVIEYDRTGPADVLTLAERDCPEPGPGEVLVAMAVSAVHPTDVKARAGARGPLPFARVVPHSDGAGRIMAVGPGVSPTREGERVWVYNAAWGRADGTAAEYVALPAALAVPLPDAASDAEGACLGIPAQTAYACLFTDGPLHGADVLVTGGAGTVGAYAIQMAKLDGARVITTVSSPEKADVARALGADVVIDYRREDATAAILDATDGRGFARIVEVEFGGNLAQTRAVLRDGGVVAAYGSMAAPEPVLPYYPMMFANQTLRMVLLYKLEPRVRAAAIGAITAWAGAGKLRHPVGRRWPLKEAAAAHEHVESGARIGVALLDIDAAGDL